MPFLDDCRDLGLTSAYTTCQVTAGRYQLPAGTLLVRWPDGSALAETFPAPAALTAADVAGLPSDLDWI